MELKVFFSMELFYYQQDKTKSFQLYLQQSGYESNLGVQW